MVKSIVFVDYENAGKIDLESVPPVAHIHFFFGATQKLVSTEFLKGALKLGNRFASIDIQGQGKNALDFHIAFYVGEAVSADPKTRCRILSRDKGFDPLVTHLRTRGFDVQRAESLSDAFPSQKTAPSDTRKEVDDPYAVATRMLNEMQPRSRPRKRKSLTAHLHSIFRERVDQTQIAMLIDQLIAEKKLSELNGALTYYL